MTNIQRKKAVQFFSKEQLEKSKAMTPEQRLRFLDNFAKLHATKKTNNTIKSKLISLKVPEDLLENFKTHCELNNVKYQTRIKQLMMQHIALPENNQ